MEINKVYIPFVMLLGFPYTLDETLKRNLLWWDRDTAGLSGLPGTHLLALSACGFSLVFWIGDLNYRIAGMSLDDVKMYIQKQMYKKLLLGDQVGRCCLYKFLPTNITKHLQEMVIGP